MMADSSISSFLFFLNVIYRGSLEKIITLHIYGHMTVLCIYEDMCAALILRM